MNGKQLLVLIGGTVATLAVVAALAFTSRSNMALSNSCRTSGHNYVVTIVNGKVDKPRVSARRCDTLTIKNQDATIREIGFGPHEQHQAYDGVSDKVLRQNESLMVTMVASGTFHFHDHFHDDVAGTFIVSR